MLPETLAKRTKYRPIQDRVIAVRRHPESGSAILAVGTDHWMRNWRCDVIAVGPGKFCKKAGVVVPLDIEVGDVIWVNPLDGEHLAKGEDPMLLSILVTPAIDSDGHVYKGALAKQEAKTYIDIDGNIVKATEIDHVYHDGEGEYWEPGSFMITHLPSLKQEVMGVNEFRAKYLEAAQHAKG